MNNNRIPRFLMEALMTGNMGMLCTSNVAYFNAQDEYGCTPLMHAANRNNAAFARILINNSARLNTVDSAGMTALMWAIRSNSIDVARILMQEPQHLRVNLIDKSSRTALDYAVANGSVEIVRMLLSRNANPSNVPKSKHAGTALMAAIITRRIDMAIAMMEYSSVKQSINVVAKKGKTALMCAAKIGNAEVLQILLENGAGASIGFADKDGMTALMHASIRFIEGVRLLLTYGADAGINVVHKKTTALQIAFDCGNRGIACLLMQHGAQFDRSIQNLNAMAVRAANVNLVSIVCLLLELGASPTCIVNAEVVPTPNAIRLMLWCRRRPLLLLSTACAQHIATPVRTDELSMFQVLSNTDVVRCMCSYL